MSRLTQSTLSGYTDVESPSLRICYPARVPGGRDAPILPIPEGKLGYRLVVFIHGQRAAGGGGLCPTDVTGDHKMWGSLLHLVSSCGFVAVAVNVSDTNSNTGQAAADVVAGLDWARNSWVGRNILVDPPVVIDPEQPPPLPNVAAVGHSWGAKVAAQLAAEGKVRCVAGISGTWDDNDSVSNLVRANLPTLLVAATEDGVNAAAPSAQQFCQLQLPRHQVTLSGIGHWDLSGIGPCDGTSPPQARGSRMIAAEVLVVFLHRYLYNTITLEPSLLAAPLGNRPSLTPYVAPEGVCAVRSRWQDLFSTGARSGEAGLGRWPENKSPWPECPTLELTPDSLNFGQVSIGTARTRTVTIGNATYERVKLAYPGGDGVFSWEGFDGFLDPQAQRLLHVTFRPASNDFARGALTVTSSAFGSPHRITMIGKGPGGFVFPPTPDTG